MVDLSTCFQMSDRLIKLSEWIENFRKSRRPFEMGTELDNDLLRAILEQSSTRPCSNYVAQMVASALDFFVEDIIARTCSEPSQITPNDILNVIKSMPEYQFAEPAITAHLPQ
jgi:hypothetical protein